MIDLWFEMSTSTGSGERAICFVAIKSMQLPNDLTETKADDKKYNLGACKIIWEQQAAINIQLLHS